jgi:hypothetical protein
MAPNLPDGQVRDQTVAEQSFTSRKEIALRMDFAFSAMAARSDISPARWRRPFLSWLDGIEAGWAVPLLLVGFVAVWMAYLVIAYLWAICTLMFWRRGRSDARLSGVTPNIPR